MAITCRHRCIRAEALDTAASCPKIPGLLGWENDMLLSVARWVRAKEELGLQDDCLIVPEQNRIRFYNVTFSLSKRSGLLVYSLWSPAGEEEFLSRVVEW